MLCSSPLSSLHSFPTRRSSDLWVCALNALQNSMMLIPCCPSAGPTGGAGAGAARDRKRTRLNSSHQMIAYAVFRLTENIGLMIHLFVALNVRRGAVFDVSLIER